MYDLITANNDNSSHRRFWLNKLTTTKQFVRETGRKRFIVYDRYGSDWLMYFHMKELSSVKTNKTFCPKVICQPGRYKVYGEIVGGYGWRCDLCPVNHYKSTVGDNGCKP